MNIGAVVGTLAQVAADTAFGSHRNGSNASDSGATPPQPTGALGMPSTLLDKSTPMLEARSLSCVRGDKTLFKDLSFSLEPGRPCQIVGPNGTGKTTLLRALCGLTLPAAGQILWGGQELARVYQEFIATVTYVGHAAGVKLDLTAGENLRFDQELNYSADDIDMASILARLDLRACAHLPCRQLSAGQRRRVALGKLLTRRASVWLLDEPFTSIDQDGIKNLTGMMDYHLASGGALAVATHQPIAFRNATALRLGLGA